MDKILLVVTEKGILTYQKSRKIQDVDFIFLEGCQIRIFFNQKFLIQMGYIKIWVL